MLFSSQKKKFLNHIWSWYLHFSCTKGTFCFVFVEFHDILYIAEVSFPKMGSAKKGKKHSVEDSDDSDFITPKKKKRVKDKLLDAKISDSESDTGKKGKKGKKKG